MRAANLFKYQKYLEATVEVSAEQYEEVEDILNRHKTLATTQAVSVVSQPVRIVIPPLANPVFAKCDPCQQVCTNNVRITAAHSRHIDSEFLRT